MDLRSRFTLGNKPFHAIMTQPNKTISLLGVVSHLMHVERQYRFVQAGTTIKDACGDQFILAEHHSYGKYLVLNAMRVTGDVEVIEFTDVIHPVTKMKSGRQPLPAVTTPAVKSPLSEDKDSDFKVKKDSYILATPITESATINGKAVTDVSYVMGVYIAEVG